MKRGTDIKITRPYLNRWLNRWMQDLGFLDLRVVHSYKTKMTENQYQNGAAIYIFTINGHKIEGILIYSFIDLPELQNGIDRGEKLTVVQKTKFSINESYITTIKQ